MILGNGVWKTRYGSDPRLIGRSIKVNDVPVDRDRGDAGGVQVPGQRRPVAAARAAAATSTDAKRDARNLEVFGRLANSVTRRAGQRGTRGDRSQLAHDYPETNKDIHATVHDVQRALQRRTYQAHVPVADGRRRVRAPDRVRERRQPAARPVGVTARARFRCASRSARPAGASSASCWSKACCWPLISGVLGLALALCRHSSLRCGRRRTSASRIGSQFTMDAHVSLRSSRPSASAPALSSASRPALHCRKPTSTRCSKRADVRAAAASAPAAGRASLIVAELALDACAARWRRFMMRSFLTLYRMDLGIDTSHLLTMRLALPIQKYPTPVAATPDLLRTARSTARRPSAGSSRPRSPRTCRSAAAMGGCSHIDGRAAGRRRTAADRDAWSPSGPAISRRSGCALLRGRMFDALDGDVRPRFGHRQPAVRRRCTLGSDDPIGRRIQADS